MTPVYSVLYYLNNTLQKTLNDLSDQEAYVSAAPKAAYENVPNNNWHLMLRTAAVPRMNLLFVGETIRIAWQDNQVEHILIQRTS
jgi:hypothetical protein